tara:strand:+ start:8833 stop:9567 length:735 start_codon:yes stop_codon:yes gene_type:complete
MEEILNILLNSNPDLVYGSLLGTILGGNKAKRDARRLRRKAVQEKRVATSGIKTIENNRQPVINPYANAKDLSSLAKDLSGNLSNPFANLSVATGAAKMQAEEADIALANTLDTIRATGAGAGGATALAQAALKSKKGIAAGIEKQEVANEKMKASGQQQLERLQNAEQARVQGVQIGEGRRMQTAEAKGLSYQFEAQERRDQDKLNDLRRQRNAASDREWQTEQMVAQAEQGALGGILKSLGM